MAAPTYAQIIAELNDWQNNPNKRYINGAKLIGLMTQYLNYLTNNGAYDPGTFMQQVVGVIGTYPDRFSSLRTTLYVNQATGNDSNTGTEAAPLKSIKRAADLVRNKFQKVEVVILSNYNHAEYAHFQVPEVLITVRPGFTFTFKSFTNGGLGGATYPLIFEGNELTLYGDATSYIVVEAHTGPQSGYANNYYYQLNQGAIQCGNSGIQTIHPMVNLTNFGGITVGNYTSLLTAREGLTSNFSTPNYSVEAKFIRGWTLGTQSNICVLARKSYFRKTISLNTANTWKTLAERSELNLLAGSYVVSLRADTSGANGVMYAAIFTGVMSWPGESANDSQNEPREILLHGAGTDLNGKSIKLRTVPAAGNARLEIASDESLSAAILIEIIFTKQD